jgi:hypothetical protein
MDGSIILEWFETASAGNILLAAFAFLVLLMMIIACVYLAKSARGSASVAYQSLISKLHDFDSMLAEHPEQLALLNTPDASGLDEKQKLQQRVLTHMFFDNYQSLRIQWIDGLISEAVWISRKRALGNWLHTTNLKHLWDNVRSDYSSGFRRFVDDTIAVKF